MLRGSVKFAVVREDPSVESQLITRLGARRVLLVASGGCTALTLMARHDDLHITAFDINAAQLDLVAEKHALLARGVPVGMEDVRRRSFHGAFESLFRQLRAFLVEFVTDDATLAALCGPLDSPTRSALAEQVTAHPYWPVAFELFLSDALLHAMFGPAATQHAEPGSYPRYFRELLARALHAEDTARNPWMHHVLMDNYRPDALPLHWTHARREGTSLELVHGTLDAVTADEPYDVISLSNLCDWMDAAQVHALGHETLARLRAGGVVVLRQLNNSADLAGAFPGVTFDVAGAEALAARERSRFYGRVLVGTRRG